MKYFKCKYITGWSYYPSCNCCYGQLVKSALVSATSRSFKKILFHVNSHQKQECIPVGCVPPACWTYLSMHCWVGCTCSRGCTCPGGVPAPGGGTCPRVYLPRGCTCPGGTCPGGYLPRGLPAQAGTYPGTPPCEQNDWQTGVKT